MDQLVVLTCCLFGLAAAAPPAPYDLAQADKYFQDFMSTHDKQYSSESEKMERFEIFKQNLESINEQNKIDGGAVFGITKFSDLTVEEFKSSHGCLRKPMGPSPCHGKTAPTAGPVPEEHDWRKLNKVTRVKNQKACASCWAFSTTGNIEGQYAMLHNELKEFSESQLVDCDHTDDGCSGGLMDRAILYVKNAGGMMTEQDYPYRPKNGECKFDKTKVQAEVTECNQYRPKTEDELKEILFNVGPLSIGVDSNSFMGYRSGIIMNCTSQELDHGVLLVGYGTDNGTPYWLIKNSWGTKWGESGYVRVQRNVNACKMMAEEGQIVSAVVKK